MNEKNDKTETFEFDRIRDSESYKKPVERKENDIYSEARKINYHNDYEEKNEKKLVSVIIILVALLTIAIVAGFFIIMHDRNNNLSEENNNLTQEEQIAENEPAVEETKPEEPPVIEEENKVNTYEAIFYSDEIDRKNSCYVIKAALVNRVTGEEDLRRIKIDKNTEIRKNGDRIILDAFISLVEELAGEQLVYSVEINEEEDYAESISFKAVFSDIIPEKPVEDKEDTSNNETIENSSETTENEAPQEETQTNEQATQQTDDKVTE